MSSTADVLVRQLMKLRKMDLELKIIKFNTILNILKILRAYTTNPLLGEYLKCDFSTLVFLELLLSIDKIVSIYSFIDY